MASPPQIEEFPFADGSHEEDHLAEMASLADMASIADLPPEKSVLPAEESVLPDADLNDPQLVSENEIADRNQEVLCTECREIRKTYLRTLIAITRNNTLIMEDSIKLRQELTELNRRIQICKIG